MLRIIWRRQTTFKHRKNSLVSVNLASTSTAIIRQRQTRGSFKEQVGLSEIFRDFFSGGTQFSTLTVTPTNLTLAFFVRRLLENLSE